MKFPQGISSKQTKVAICFCPIIADLSEWIMVPNYLCFSLLGFSYMSIKEIYLEIGIS